MSIYLDRYSAGMFGLMLITCSNELFNAFLYASLLLKQFFQIFSMSSKSLSSSSIISCSLRSAWPATASPATAAFVGSDSSVGLSKRRIDLPRFLT